MNRSADILQYLSETKDSEVIIIAPMAPPVDRSASGLRVALHQILDASDVADTLAALHNRATGMEGSDLEGSGSFSFGLKDVGRFRVSFTTQRGSKVASITRVPVAVPDLENLSSDTDEIGQLLEFLTSGLGGVCVYGPSVAKNALLVYSLVQQVNQSERRVIYCVERMLNCLMQHSNSIIVQSEMGVDVRTLHEGIDTGLRFAPDIMYVGDVRAPEELDMVTRAMESGIATVFTSVASTPEVLHQVFRECKPSTLASLRSLLRGTYGITPNDDGSLHIAFTGSSPFS